MDIRIINKNQAAALAGVDPKTIFNWVKKGYLNKYIVKGRRTFKVSEKEVMDYLRAPWLVKSMAKPALKCYIDESTGTPVFIDLK